MRNTIAGKCLDRDHQRPGPMGHSTVHMTRSEESECARSRNEGSAHTGQGYWCLSMLEKDIQDSHLVIAPLCSLFPVWIFSRVVEVMREMRPELRNIE